MEGKGFFLRLVKLNRTLFENAYQVTVHFQDQVEKLGNAMADQAGWVSAEHREGYDRCLDACKEARISFKAFIDEGYRNAESVLSQR